VSGPDDVRVVWLGEDAPRDDARRALVGWARARGLSLLDADGSPRGRATRRRDEDVGPSLAVAERVERDLDRAREAVAALEGDAAERALARAEAELRAHPELPSAAWLRAEVLRAWSSRWMRIEPREPALARAAWQDASALDGGRAAGVGETAFPDRATARTRILVHGAAGSGAVIRLDGRPLATARAGDALQAEVDVADGEHQLTVQLDASTRVAAWVAIATAAHDPRPVDVTLPEDAACTASTLGTAVRDGDQVRAGGIACRHWVAVVASPRPDAILVARCAQDGCGPLLPWRAEPLPAPPPIPPGRAPWPRWATWVMVGVGAAAAGTFGLVASGVFEARPTEPRFVAGGIKNE
jgi:hypothetical protein